MWLLYLTIIEGLISVVWLLLIPGEEGISPLRALYLVGLLLILAGLTLGTAFLRRGKSEARKLVGRLERILHSNTALAILAICLMIVILGVASLYTAFTTTDRHLQGILTRLAPAIFWLTAFCTGAAAMLISRRREFLAALTLPSREEALRIVLVSVFSLLIYHTVSHKISHWEELPEAVYGIIIRRPHWRAYANRLLGPWAVYLLSLSGISFATALEILTFVLILAQNLTLYHLVKQKTASCATGIRYVLYYSLGLIVVQDTFIYPWDYIDALIFTFFAWGILQEKPARYFVLLFLIELLNREIALLFAAYLLLDAWELADFPRLRLSPAKRRQAILGAFLFLGGAVYTKIIRDLLFIESSLKRVGDDLQNKLLGNHIHLADNVRDLFIANFTSLEAINSLIFLGIVAYLFYQRRRFDHRHYRLSLMILAMLVAILIFGRVNETRMLISVLPMMLFLHLDVSQQPENGSKKGLC